MDVIKPWIARRVTELLGFEDEVLINFIYGLLEGEVMLLLFDLITSLVCACSVLYVLVLVY